MMKKMMEVNKYFEICQANKVEMSGSYFDISSLWKYKTYPYEPKILEMLHGHRVPEEKQFLKQKFRHLSRYWKAMEFEGALYEKLFHRSRSESEPANVIRSLNVSNLNPELIFKDFYVLFGSYADCLDSVYEILKSDSIKALAGPDYVEILEAVKRDADCYRKHALKTPLYLKNFLEYAK